MICGSGGSTSRLAKAAGAEPAGQMRDEKLHAVVARSPLLEVEMSKKCTPLWRETHVEVKMYKHTRSGPLLEVEMSKKCTPLWREAHFQVKMYKHTRSGPLLEVEMSKKCTPLWREACFEVKMFKTPHVRATFERLDVVSRSRRKGLYTSKVSKT